MKKYSFLAILLFIGLSSFAEKRKDYPVNVSVKDQPIRVLFNQIETQLDRKFSYNTKLLNADSIITYQGHKPVKKVITEVFNKSIQAKIVGGFIVLTPGKKEIKADEKKNNQLITFRGTILHAETRTPLSQASIYEISSRVTTLTNEQGEFELHIEKGTIKNFNIAKTNFSDTVVAVNLTENNEITVYLQPIISPIVVEPMSTEKAILPDSSLVVTMVPEEKQITSDNLMTIDDIVLWQVSLVPSIGTNRKASGIVTNHFSFNALGGYNGGVEGIEVGGLFNILTRDMNGFQVAGITNQTKGVTNGIQVAGIFNYNKQKVSGIQVGGIANYLHQKMVGLQVAGISNLNNSSVTGLQAAGIFNLCNDTLIGLQVAGISNSSQGPTSGLQLAGIHNLSTRNLNGAQISVIHNQTYGKMNGLQLGLVNHAHYNNGLQLGLVNIADSANGAAIGLFNYIREGYHPLEAFSNEVLYANLAFKTGVNAFYTTWTAGLRPTEPEIFGFGFGIGSRINTWKWLSFSIDLTATAINEKPITNNYNWELNVLSRLDVTLDINIWKLTFFGGPGLNLHTSQMGYAEFGQFTTNIAQDPFHTEVVDGTQFQLWYGGKAGLRYNF